MGYKPGDISSIEFQVGHVDDESMSFASPMVTWLKDGMPFGVPPTNSDPQNNGGLESIVTFNFSSSDVGVYQCVFIDTADSEVFVVDPIRLDSGKFQCINSILL